jgi:hypothetical protein
MLPLELDAERSGSLGPERSVGDNPVASGVPRWSYRR